MTSATIRWLEVLLVAAVLGSCARSEPAALANYQFNAPVAEVVSQLLALAKAGSRLSRIAVRRPPLQASVKADGEAQLVTIAVPGGTRLHPVVLTFRVTPYIDKYAMVALTVDAPDLGEIDLGPERFAASKSLGKSFGDALGMMTHPADHSYPGADPQRRFGRLFDLAAVLDDPALRKKVERRAKQPGSVDFLFFDVPPGERFVE